VSPIDDADSIVACRDKLERGRRMIELRRTETGPGLVFDVSAAGDAAAPLVLLLHGFAVSRHLYDAQVPALAQGGLLRRGPRTSAATPPGRGPIRPTSRSTTSSG
jgi:hypothetical protein